MTVCVAGMVLLPPHSYLLNVLFISLFPLYFVESFIMGFCVHVLVLAGYLVVAHFGIYVDRHKQFPLASCLAWTFITLSYDTPRGVLLAALIFVYYAVYLVKQQDPFSSLISFPPEDVRGFVFYGAGILFVACSFDRLIQHFFLWALFVVACINEARKANNIRMENGEVYLWGDSSGKICKDEQQQPTSSSKSGKWWPSAMWKKKAQTTNAPSSSTQHPAVPGPVRGFTGVRTGVPFSQGAMRQAYFFKFVRDTKKMKEEENEDPFDLLAQKCTWIADNFNAVFVIKRYVPGLLQDRKDEEDTIYNDLVLQLAAKQLANAFNAKRPPHTIRFVDAAVLRFAEGDKTTLWWIEPYLPGKYVKHNNNAGWINTTDLDDTPHAFSHFTYQHTNGEVLVVDIQGVGRAYTDPQIHTHLSIWKRIFPFRVTSSMARERYGKGNLQREGIKAWESTHRCNRVCRALGLRPLSSSSSSQQSSSSLVVSRWRPAALRSLFDAASAAARGSILGRVFA
jgi:hypothetical protein